METQGVVEAVVLDLASHKTERLPLTRLERFAAPVWLDEHRVAALNQGHTSYDWVDIQTGVRGSITKPRQGWVFDAACSPRDGTIAIRRNTSGVGQSLWDVSPDGAARLLDSEHEAVARGIPFWNAAGDLFVFDPISGDVERLAVDTGVATRWVNIPIREGFAVNDVPWFDGDDLLVTEIRRTYDLAVILAQ
jgi:hypothetical protein